MQKQKTDFEIISEINHSKKKVISSEIIWTEWFQTKVILIQNQSCLISIACQTLWHTTT
jgi:hypothetical protein